jgi:hypothetical protein
MPPPRSAPWSGVAGGLIGFFLGAWGAKETTRLEGFDVLGVALQAAIGGAVAGAGLGTWPLLSIRGRARAALTGALTVALTPPLLRLVIVLVSLGLLEALPGLALWGLGLGTTAVAALCAEGSPRCSAIDAWPWKRMVTVVLWVAAGAETVVMARLILP